MRLASKWRSAWEMDSGGCDGVGCEQIDLGGEWVEVARLGHGEPLVVVPGLAGGWRLVLPLLKRLARDFEVFAYSPRGDRASGGLAQLEGRPVRELADHARDLASVIEHLGLECSSVLGVSFGGAIALEAAVEHSHRVSSLVVSGAEARFRSTLGAKIARRVLERFPLPADSLFVNQFLNLLYAKRPEPGPLVDFVVDRIWETEQSVMAERLAQLETFDVSDRLWRIDAPTLVIAGGRDAIVPAARQRGLADEITGARFEQVADAGHIGFLTHRDEFARSVVRHLSAIRTAV